MSSRTMATTTAATIITVSSEKEKNEREKKDGIKKKTTKVTWSSDTIDNEKMNKKSSKGNYSLLLSLFSLLYIQAAAAATASPFPISSILL